MLNYRMKIGVVGNGYVGKATAFMASEHDVMFNDVDESKSDWSLEKMARDCDLVFICVPTPMNEDGSCHLDIVNSVTSELKSFGASGDKIVLRSTVPVGTSKSMGINFMPEFLTEKNWKQDISDCKHWIFGLSNKDGELNILVKRIVGSDKTVHFCSTREAELCKNIRNCFLATKVSFFNEVNEFCERVGVSYEEAKRLTLLDERISSSHTQVPGHDGKKGFGGTCFPKDIRSLMHQMNEVNMESYILKAAIYRNENVDRPDKDWQANKGRSVI